MIIPLIDCTETKQKLDASGIWNVLIDRYGRGTTAFSNLNFFSASHRFDEKDEKQVYKISYEINILTEKNHVSFIIGESGLFLKSSIDSYSFINEMIKKYEAFIILCKLFLFTPVGVIHISDGDSYINPVKHQGYFDKERLRKQFNDVEFFDEQDV